MKLRKARFSVLVTQNRKLSFMIVSIYQPRIPFYREAFFENLIELGIQSGIEYRVFAPLKIRNSRSDEHFMNKNVKRLKSFRVRIAGRELVLFSPFQIVRECDFLISEHAMHDLFCLMNLLKLMPKKHALWGHGKNYTSPEVQFIGKVKNRMTSRVIWYFVYTANGAKHLIANNFDSKKLTVLNNSVDVKSLVEKVNSAKRLDPEQIRLKYGIQTELCLLYIGALDESKRINFIIDTLYRLEDLELDFTLAVCGSGPLSDVLTANHSSRVKLIGYADETVKAELSRISLAILNPGRVGLLAVDSFALECPVITTNWSYHAPEFEYLESGRNAIISSNSIEDYVDQIRNYVGDKELQQQLSNGCSLDAEKFSIEKMAGNFHKGVIQMMVGHK